MKSPFKSLIATGVFLFSLAMSVGIANSTETVVAGTNDPAVDVKVVQDAIDQGGEILLKGIFNFGEKGQIKISRDIKIRGERDQEGTPVTAISGGFLTFFSPLPNEIPLQMPGPKITIQDLHFDAATWAPICISYGSGAVITGNKITNVKPYLGTMPVFGRTDIYRQHGIVLVPRYGGAKGYLAGAVTGTVLIADNDIDLTCENFEKTMSQGVFIVEATGLEAHVLRNRIVNCSRNSIEALDNYRDDNGKGIAIIQGNKIVTSTVGCPVPGPTNHPNGIVVGWFLDPSGGQDPSRNSTVVIVDNQIEARGEFASGVISLGDGISIASNEIVMDGGKQSKAILQLGSYGFVAHNSIKGSSTFGIWTMPFRDVLKGSHNTFFKNDTKLLKASMAEVLCEGNNNFFVGSECNFQDKGKDNKILIDG